MERKSRSRKSFDKVSTRKDTVGKASREASFKPIDTQDPIELQRSLQEDYIDELIECVMSNRDQFEGDFFIVVITKRERLMPNVFRNYFFTRHSCPTPDYDQAVYQYHSAEEVIDYLWCIPDKETCLLLKDNVMLVVQEERHLLQHVLDFSDGSLFALAQKLNNEQQFTPFLES